MRTDPLPPFQAEAEIAVDFAGLDALFRHLADDHGLTLRSGHGRSTWVTVGEGEFGARQRGAATTLYARAHSADWLFTLQEAAAAHLADHAPDAVGLRWTGPAQAGALPPNFSLGRVASVERVSAQFVRMRVQGDGLDRLARDMIHFRMVLPSGDGATEWPRLSGTGQTIWPQPLHRPAYTIRAIDLAAGWLETDVFVHEGGRVCAFAQAAAPGTVVGLIGPGGGGIPLDDRLLIGGDETAYPALARIIAAQGPGARIACHLLGASADYPLPDHPGLTLHHHPRGEDDLARLLVAEAPDAGQFWLATEKSRLQPLRQAVLTSLGVPKTRAHLAAYWNAA
ncbi:siderophore-interacting protein [Paracoccus luteus]|uniref:siderophore-interacting protein n=1 Tax=Paracoccus luteus TaxID=2508543 RepID=UPI001070521B|nr:siderophore-interacting protein [Paracoccus luteus]